jgi:IEC3 subunit of the Ino80 complex, chromatin re-modelling
LLELLYDLNQAPQVLPSHRYDLQPPTVASSHPTDDDQGKANHFEPNIAPTALREARQGLRNSRMSIADYRRMEESLLKSNEFKPMNSYASLLELPHASLHDIKVNNDAADTVLNGFPTPQEEERYLEGLDSYLNGTAQTARPFATGNARGGDRSIERDREMALKNPVSVCNWLRKHQPQVFLQDNEAHAEKASTRLATSRASKRASIVKQESDLYDEDGIAIDVGSSSRGKRKRDDDGGYRPKGGNGRPLKRKKEDGSASAKKSKRASISGVT